MKQSKLREELREMKFYNPGVTRWLALSENDIEKILSLFSTAIEEKKLVWIVAWFIEFNNFVDLKAFEDSEAAHAYAREINQGRFHAEVYREKVRKLSDLQKELGGEE